MIDRLDREDGGTGQTETTDGHDELIDRHDLQTRQEIKGRYDGQTQ